MSDVKATPFKYQLSPSLLGVKKDGPGKPSLLSRGVDWRYDGLRRRIYILLRHAMVSRKWKTRWR